MRKLIGTAIFALLFITLPSVAAPKIESTSDVGVGQCFVVRLVSAEGVVKAHAFFLGKRYELFKNADIYQTVIGVPLEARPRIAALEIEYLETGDQTKKIAENIKIIKVKYPATSFWLKPAKKKLLVSNLVNDEWAQIERILLVEDQNKYWQGTFAFPASGPTSMTFGTIEKVNGKKRGQHRGLDLAVCTGTTVEAANNGKVVFAGKLQAFGGTVVIDHGQGIHSLYFHLSKLLVQVGEEIEKGRAIAYSGNTGVSSGPHLHWGVSVHNLRVNPIQWTRVAF